MYKLFVFAGTTEGRELVFKLAQAQGKPVEIHVFTATEYGKEILDEELSLTIQGEEEQGEHEQSENEQNNKRQVTICSHAGRLSADQMAGMMKDIAPIVVLDCTHPYAVEVGENIKKACQDSGVPYIRHIGENRKVEQAEGVVYVKDAREAAEYLKNTDGGNVLLTIGSKEVGRFSGGELSSRVFPRMLPMEDGIKKSLEAGIPLKNMICMQGAFTVDMNRAMIKQIGAKFLVTKETGITGGYPEKLEAARREGITAVIIKRPDEDGGKTASEILSILTADFGINFPEGTNEKPGEIHGGPGNVHKQQGEIHSETKSQRWFPAFIDTAGKKALVVGGGKIALRRIKTLARFSWQVTVLAPEVLAEVKEMADQGKIKMELRGFQPGDCTGYDLATGATNSRKINRMVGEEARAQGILVSTADAKEESTFYFPAVIEKGPIVIGVTSGGKNHGLVKETAAEIRKFLNIKF